MAKRAKIKTKSKDNFIVRWSKRIQFSSLNQVSLHTLIGVLMKGISNRTFGLRVGAVAWAFFFSLFPFLLFLFSILPYAPLYQEIKTILFSEFIPRILPERITTEVVDYISQTATGKTGRNPGWIFILLTILLSSNGITVMINGFNASYHGYAKQRKGINNRLISIILTLFFVAFIIAQLILVYYTNFIWQYIEEYEVLVEVSTMTKVLNFVAASLFYFTSLVMLYYYGTNLKQKFRNVFPGALMATFLFFSTLIGFQYYVTQLNYYDVLYGSVGLVMVMMVFVYINVLLIMIGFELNAAIYHVKIKNDKEIENN
ncbi:MAG: YihY/virulence factor BrkB family protein [Weeksellaceae bacterium]|jgi:membrane protein|nr:YihY/virulence factor BrkB family protein [Weeksellaceae bacterium]MDX9705232.1 YihY/virulence factor BrkB family protein [Weeksellaceae bacterium]